MHAVLSATLIKVEHGMAVLSLGDGQELKVPKEQLQPLPEIGSPMSLKISPESEANLDKNELAKTILNQLLGDEA